jgi:hypothetical protein
MTLREFLKANYPAVIWFRIVLFGGLLCGFILSWSDVVSGDWMRVALNMLSFFIWFYGIHLISHALVLVSWFFAMKRWGIKTD